MEKPDFSHYTSSGRGERALLMALLLAGGLVTFVVAPMIASTSKACPFDYTRGICNPLRQHLTALLPRIGAPAAVVIGLTGVLWSHRRELMWVCTGLLVLVLVWLADALVAGGH